MRQFLAVVLIAVLTSCLLPELLAGSDPRAQALAIPTGSPVEVRLSDNTKLRGRLLAITETDFELQSANQTGVAIERIRFDKMKSIRDIHAVTPGVVMKRTLLVIGIVIGIVAVVFAVACANGCGG